MEHRGYRMLSVFACLCALGLALGHADPAVSAFGPRVYFSSNGDPAGALLAVIGSAHTRIEAAIYDLTDPRIGDALIAAVHRHVDTYVIMDARQARYRSSQYPRLSAALGDRVVLRTGRGSNRFAIMHQKVLIADGTVTATGSFNWTIEAECCNWENLVILGDSTVAQQYEQEFRRIWAGR